MAVYKITDNLNDFKAVCSGPDKVAVQLGNFDYFERIILQAVDNKSLKDIWKPALLEFEDVLNQNSLLPDVSLWLRTFLVLSPKAYGVLCSVLEKNGEFLPVFIGDEKWHLFTVLTFGKEDRPKCVEKISYGSPDGIEVLVFDDDDIKDKVIFKSQLEGASNLYCNDIFKSLCEVNGLTGLQFSTELTDPFS